MTIRYRIRNIPDLAPDQPGKISGSFPGVFRVRSRQSSSLWLSPESARFQTRNQFRMDPVADPENSEIHTGLPSFCVTVSFLSAKYISPPLLLQEVSQPAPNTKKAKLSLFHCCWPQKLQDLSSPPTKLKSLLGKPRGCLDLRFHRVKSDSPLSSSSCLLLLGLLGNPRRLGSPGSFRVVDCASGKFVKVRRSPQDLPIVDWALSSWKRLKEKKVSLRGVG